MDNPFADLVSPRPMSGEPASLESHTGAVPFGHITSREPMSDGRQRFEPASLGQVMPNTEPARRIRGFRRSTPSDPSRPDAGEAIGFGALDVATLGRGDDLMGVLGAIPQAAEIPIDAGRWLYQRAFGDAASTDEETRRIYDAITKTVQAYQMERDTARGRRHQAEDEYLGATRIGNALGSIALAHRLGVPLWRLVPFARRFQRPE
jgi:hypothetical protein